MQEKEKPVKEELKEAMNLCSNLLSSEKGSLDLDDIIPKEKPVYNTFEPGSQPRIVEGNHNNLESQNNNNSVILKLLKMLEEKDKQIKEKDQQIAKLTQKLLNNLE